VFNFVVNPKCAAFRRLKTVVSRRTTNLAAALATQQAWTSVKENYPSRWRSPSLDWKQQVGGAASPLQAQTWQQFKAMLGGAPVRGFLTGTTFKSISYRLKGKGRGEIFLKGKWPDFTVEDQKMQVNAQDVAGFGTEPLTYKEAGQLAMAALAAIAAKGQDLTQYGLGESYTEDELSIPDFVYGREMLGIIQDLGTINLQFNTIRTIRGTARRGGVLWGRDVDNQIMITPEGMKYVRTSYLGPETIRRGMRTRRITTYHKINQESMRTKAFGTRRNAMFKGGGTRRGDFRVPPELTAPVDVLFLSQRSRGGAAKSGMAGPFMSDVGKVYGIVESFYRGIINKK